MLFLSLLCEIKSKVYLLSWDTERILWADHNLIENKLYYKQFIEFPT